MGVWLALVHCDRRLPVDPESAESSRENQIRLAPSVRAGLAA
jgi:hypothetical protein